jgi:transcriptional regulator with XRE-family HTH domain
VSDEAKRFGRRLARIMEEEGDSQEDIARITGADKSAVSRWLSGQGGPRADAMLALLRHYSQHILRLLFGDQLDPEPDAKPNKALLVFLQTQLGQRAVKMGIATELSRIRFSHTPSVRTYRDLARILLDEMADED